MKNEVIGSANPPRGHTPRAAAAPRLEEGDSRPSHSVTTARLGSLCGVAIVENKVHDTGPNRVLKPDEIEVSAKRVAGGQHGD